MKNINELQPHSRGSLIPYFLVFGCLFAICISVFLLCSPPPLSDYPNHVARMHIIANLDKSQYLSHFYAVKWEFIPNLAMDILVPPLVPIMGAESATFLFTASALFLIASGAIALNWQLFGRRSWLPFSVFLILFNRHFLWGFLNYLFSVGLALWFLALYFRTRSWHSASRVLVLSVLSSILLISHLHAFGSYAVFVVGYEISACWRNWRLMKRIELKGMLISIAQFTVPLSILLFFSSTARKASEVAFGDPLDKLVGLLDLFNNYNLPLDVATFFIVGLLLAYGFFTSRLWLHAESKLPLLLLTILYLCLPQMLLNSFGADRRLLMMIALLGISCLDGKLPGIAGRYVLGIGLACLLLFRTSVIATNWHAAQSVYAPVLKAIDLIKKGGKVVVVSGSESFPFLQNPPMEHVANLAVVRKDAFVNSLFAEKGAQVLDVIYASDTRFYKNPSQNYRRKRDGSLEGLMNPFKDIPSDRFDYVLLINKRFFVDDYPSQWMPIFDDDQVLLFSVKKD